jgi:hypothetical protein
MASSPTPTVPTATKPKRRGARHHAIRHKAPIPDASVENADSLTASLLGRKAEGWYVLLQEAHARYRAKEGTPPALLALIAIRSVVDGALINQALAGRSVQPGPPVAVLAPGDIAKARCETDTIPVPWWVAAALTDYFLALIDAANKEVSPPAGTNPSEWKDWTANVAAELLGAKASGRGNRGYLRKAVTETADKKLAIEVAGLLRPPTQLTLSDAITKVQELHPVRQSSVPRAWAKHGKWARSQLSSAAATDQPKDTLSFAS